MLIRNFFNSPNLNLKEIEFTLWTFKNDSDLEAQGYRSLSLPKEGKPFLDYPKKHGGGLEDRLLVVRDHAVLACLST
jgi:hypothetical protein